MELLSTVVGGSLALAANACPAQMTQVANRFYAQYLEQQAPRSRPMQLETVIRKNQAVFVPSLYQKLLAASMRNPGDGRAYLDFDPFFRHQVTTFSVNSVGCLMIRPDQGTVEMSQVAGLSRDRATSSCLRVEMVNHAGTWRISDVLTPSEPVDEVSGTSSRCGPSTTYSRLSKSLSLILEN